MRTVIRGLKWGGGLVVVAAFFLDEGSGLWLTFFVGMLLLFGGIALRMVWSEPPDTGPVRRPDERHGLV